MMKAYRINGQSDDSCFNTIIIARDKEQAEEIATERFGKLLKFNANEESVEKVKLSNLTLGDWDRMTKKRNGLEVGKSMSLLT